MKKAPRDMTPFIEGTQQLADELGLTVLRSLEAGLKDLALLKADAKATAEKLEKAEAPYRQWLAEHPEEAITDGETGLEARLEYAGTSTRYDMPSSIEARAPELYRRLKELDCIVTRLDVDQVKDMIRDGLLLAADMKPFTQEQERTRRFHIGMAK